MIDVSTETKDTVECQGHCLCGAVTITARTVARRLAACHCGTCRTWGGGPLLAVSAGADVSLDGEEFLTVYDSSPWAQRGFCARCGTHLFYRLKDPRHYELPAGLFKVLDDVPLTCQIFIDAKPASYTFANRTKDMTEAQVMAMFAS